MSKKSILLLIGSAVAMNAGAAERVVAVSSAELNVTKAQTDVLGRHNSKVRYTPQNFVKTQKSKVLAKAADYPSEESIAKTYGAFEHRNGKRWYAFNTEEGLSESQYISRINNVEDNDQARAKFIRENKKNYDDYSKIRGAQQYRIIYETLVKINPNVTWNDVNSFVIFDKAIKDILLYSGAKTEYKNHTLGVW